MGQMAAGVSKRFAAGSKWVLVGRKRGAGGSKRGLVGRKRVQVAGDAWSGVETGPGGLKTRAGGSRPVLEMGTCGWKGMGVSQRGVSKGVVVGRNARLGFEIRGWGV
jgi:hypothetical protein